ncbi:DUF2971 domain-containing protein [Vibrio parahaemolyticus]|uniref:DUF2971 domain-containing protein n=1 Tax=Vibrio parahaemolyticus TaxID=670 RepID=UPI0011EBCE8C|nr:DUF2971 domain-containing protein [Vibrio parahaemolyticus]MCX4128938.1 DUF2971 domain-containing protein [Vibrio parahaemolyticus]QHH13549.1 DUF2971 domain-containing protein [Vibrio parahaemolyticus]WHT07896.1 DUF2971 domain-containing protein [Vibrio parahaemolyticus]HCD5142266.1 DUF2971 domain-containing protein [Vibrio parahaemolyticus]
MPIEQPEKIYRYRSFSELTMDSLCRDELYFAPPSNFNDPMDCQPTVVANSNKQDLKAILSELIKRRVKSEALASLKKAKLDGENAQIHSNQVALNSAEQALENIAYNATNPDYEDHNMSVEEAERWILTCSIQDELLKQYDKGVCCFSSAPDCSLLWSHYGDQHRGLCIGYTLDRSPKPLLHKVIYDDNRTLHTSLIASAILQDDTSAKKELDNNVLLRKASPWSYESEWRLFDSVGLNDSPLTMVDITFGLRCPLSIIHTVVSALENRKGEINFYRMIQVRGSYMLSRIEVELGEIGSYYPKTARSGIEIFGPVEQ